MGIQVLPFGAHGGDGRRPSARARRAWAAAAASLGAALILATPSAAQDVAAAKALFDSGFADMQKGQYETGCPRIAESQRLDPRPGTLFTLAICESKWGRAATAVARLDEYLRVYEQLTGDQKTRQAARAAEAKKERDRLAPDVPELTITVPVGTPSGVIVRRDSIVMGAAMLGLALPVDPGEHVLSTETPEGLVWEKRITIAKGEKRSIEVELRLNEPPPAPAPEPSAQPAVSPPPAPSSSPSAPPPPAPSSSPSSPPAASSEPAPPPPPPTTTAPPRPPPPEPQSSGGAQRAVGYVLVTLGLGGVVAGGVMGSLAFKQKDILKSHCGVPVGSDDPKACDTTGLDAAKTLESTSLASTIGFAAGAGLLGVGVVVFASAPRVRERPSVLRGPSIRGVVAAGPDGVTVGAQGTF